MNVVDARGRAVALGESVGHGGEATVYRVANEPGWLAKIYEPEPRPNYILKLAWMVDHPPENPTEKIGHPSLAWPGGLLYDQRRKLKGYRMPYIQHAVPLLDVFNPRRRSEVLPQFDRRYLHRTARNLAAALSALHRSGYVAGDINESNVLVTPTALVTIIDTDSFQVREEREGNQIVYACPVGKPEYTPPELQGKSLVEVNRVPDHDAFGLAVLIFQLLMEGSHPFRAQWLGPGDPPPLEERIARGAFPYASQPAQPVAPPKNAPDLNTLHPWLAELFRRCFVDGHRSARWRPGPDLWARAIEEAEHSLVCCAEGHYYAGHLEACPYCTLRRGRNTSAARSAQTPGARTQRPAGPHAGNRGAARPHAAARQGQAASNQAGVQNRAGAGAAASYAAPRFGGWPKAQAAAGAAGGATTAAQPVGWGAANSSRGVLRSRQPFRPGAMQQWVRERVKKSLLVGGIQGALIGMFPGALVALMNWSSGSPLNWAVILALGGVSAGMLRGWKPGYRLAALIDQYVGWKIFWESVGLAAGAAGGGLVGLVFVWAIIPVFLGLILGAQTGKYLGRKFWQVGNLFGWERIWGGFSAVMAAGLGFGLSRLAGVFGANALGTQLATGLQPFTGNGSFLWAMIWLMAGVAGGALAGLLAGVGTDLLGRLSGLVD